MSKNEIGVYQLANGNWGFRLIVNTNGKKTNYRRTTDQSGNKLKTKNAAIKARQAFLIYTQTATKKKPIQRRTFGEVFDEYRKNSRSDKAFSTIRKQDSLWRNHLERKFASKYIDEITVAEVNDYLSQLYNIEEKAFSYVESFIKMFYLIFGQAYSRNYLDVDTYNKLCVNKNTRIKMPKRRTNDEDDIIVFSKEEMGKLDDYFKGTTLETSYLIGKYCGVRINECFGLKWQDIDLLNRKIHIKRQMQYQEGIIKLVPPKTQNATRTIYLADSLLEYLTNLKETIDIASIKLAELREQHQMFIEDTNGEKISSLELVNTLPNGKIRTVNSMKRHTRKIRDELDICFRYHYLRHTYGTRLAEMNTPIHILCKQMGHASSKITERYYLSVSKQGIEILINNLNNF